MRIIAGEKRGALLRSLEGEATRPTMERVKEGIFSALHFIIPGAQVLDLYAGSGQLGLGALSRGASGCTFIDNSKNAIAVIKANAASTGLLAKCRIACMDSSVFLARNRDLFDIILLDPPYGMQAVPPLLEAVDKAAAPGAQVFCETEKGVVLPERAGGLVLQKTYRYGTVMISRYRKQEIQDDQLKED